jgi:hypothetical protein
VIFVGGKTAQETTSEFNTKTAQETTNEFNKEDCTGNN